MTYRFGPLVSHAALGSALLSLSLLVGCPGDDGTAETSGSGDTTAATGTTDPGATSVDPTGGDSTGATSNMGGTGDSGTTSGGSTAGDTTAGKTGPGGVCGDFGVRMCEADPMCMPIGGAPIQFPDGGACLGPREFLECQPAGECGDAITYACEGGDGATIYQFGSTCVPTGWVPCEPPPIDLQPC